MTEQGIATTEGSLLLATPITVGGRELRNRVVSAPMERNYCTVDGRVTERYRAYLRERAAGGAALVFTEAAYVRADGRGRLRQMGVHEDGIIPDLRRLAADIHAEGALLGVELNHGGRTSQGGVSGYKPVAPSPVPCAVVGGEVPQELDATEISDLVAAYADGAARCVEAEADVLSIHAAHGYLIHQFMSPRTNLRDDEYADPLRFLDEVIAAVRKAAPVAVVGIRISAHEGVPDGLDADATFDLISRCRVDLLDFIDVSAGSYEAGEWIVQPGEWEQGLLGPLAGRYRSLGKPVSVAGRIATVEAAERLLIEGRSDLVSMARALHADPHWPRHVFAGRTPRPCIACNLCIDQLGSGDPIPCTVNPDVGEEWQRRPSPRASQPLSVLVVGAGPAGLEAARVLASAGHRVTLVEREHEIGGQFRLAALLPEYPEYRRLLYWYRIQLSELGVDLRLGTEVAPDVLAGDSLDAVVVATGAVGYVPSVAGIDHPRVFELRDWLRQACVDADAGTYTVWGADREGVGVADALLSGGAEVLLVGAQEDLAPDVGRRAKILVVPRLRQDPRVRIELGVRVERIDDDAIVLARDGEVFAVPAEGPVLVSQGITPDNGPLRMLRGLGVATHVVGDAAGEGGSAAGAIADGARIARELCEGG